MILDDYSAWNGCRRGSDYLYHWLWLLLLPSILPLSRRPGYLRAGKIKSEVRPLAGETVVCYGPAVQIQAWGISRPNDTRLICKLATWKAYVAVVRSLGLRAAIPYVLAEGFHPWTSGWEKIFGSDIYRLHPRDARYPVYCRRGTSDKDCFGQIFVEKEYRFLNGTCDPKVIVDLVLRQRRLLDGLLFVPVSRGPRYRDRAGRAECGDAPTEYGTILRPSYHPAICRLVWSRPKMLVVCKGTYRDGREWATQVRVCQDDEESDLQAVDIGSLFGRFGFEEIDILKMDIERAELAVFSENFEPWVGRIGIYLIELHDEECRERLPGTALGERQFEISRSGELTVARRVPSPWVGAGKYVGPSRAPGGAWLLVRQFAVENQRTKWLPSSPYSRLRYPAKAALNHTNEQWSWYWEERIRRARFCSARSGPSTGLAEPGRGVVVSAEHPSLCPPNSLAGAPETRRGAQADPGPPNGVGQRLHPAVQRRPLPPS